MALLRLPPEIIDSILAHIERVDHLTAFACASSECARHATRHIQYRFIQTATHNYPVWAHLALHSSLARNVRQVYLFNNPSTAGPDRCPTTLVAPLDFDDAAPDAEGLLRAILPRTSDGNTLSLTSFASIIPPCDISISAAASLGTLAILYTIQKASSIPDGDGLISQASASSAQNGSRPATRPISSTCYLAILI
ncbi:hypothetical protein AX14_006024 [Amanita brunnescens Koide BX004]|nr:hypothetical protein AX14_006024 [Amanita brunnescens Koide BX004]